MAAIHGEFASADASALTEINARLALYGPGSVTPIVLGATQQVVITSAQLSTGATALEVRIYDGANNADAAGEVVARLNLPVNGSAIVQFPQGHHCQAGTYPKVIASAAGAVDVLIHGYIK